MEQSLQLDQQDLLMLELEFMKPCDLNNFIVNTSMFNFSLLLFLGLNNLCVCLFAHFVVFFFLVCLFWFLFATCGVEQYV